MAHKPDSLHPEKHSIVDELFIKTANENYIAARWSYEHGLHVDFFWLSVHCLEKYLKAVLLLNGRSAKRFSHDIEKLYAAVRPLAPELLPDELPKPEMPPSLIHTEIDFWHAETVTSFLERLYNDGQPDNRYQLYGFVSHAEDLFKLDQVVFRIRRLCRSLEAHFLGRIQEGVPNESVRQRILKDPVQSWSNLMSRLEENAAGKRGEVLRHALLNCNFQFAPSDYQHDPLPYRTASLNPVLVRRLYDPLAGGPTNFEKADALWQWVKTNIKLPDKLISEIETERQRLKAEAQG
jgi:hypothetical protein